MFLLNPAGPTRLITSARRSLLPQPYRKRLNGPQSPPPPTPPPSYETSPKRLLYKTKNTHNESSYSDLDWRECSSVFHRAQRKINHANQSSHGAECLSHPVGSASKHSAAATVILAANTANQVNGTHIYLLPASQMPQTAHKGHSLRFSLSKQRCKYGTIIHLCYS